MLVGGTGLFESNVILDRYKTRVKDIGKTVLFESNVILDRYKTYSTRRRPKIRV